MVATFNSIVAGVNQGAQILTVGTLPIVVSVVPGYTAIVTDALAPSLGGIVAAGGVVSVRVFSDGTNWRVG